MKHLIPQVLYCLTCDYHLSINLRKWIHNFHFDSPFFLKKFHFHIDPMGGVSFEYRI